MTEHRATSHYETYDPQTEDVYPKGQVGDLIAERVNLLAEAEAAHRLINWYTENSLFDRDVGEELSIVEREYDQSRQWRAEQEGTEDE